MDVTRPFDLKTLHHPAEYAREIMLLVCGIALAGLLGALLTGDKWPIAMAMLVMSTCMVVIAVIGVIKVNT